ncbi:MAG: uracil-DNA glycosylase [Mariprofundaceae bacterium]|nr:uracil-DNA glycosylase [Mariprofundaceae bacterium]
MNAEPAAFIAAYLHEIGIYTPLLSATDPVKKNQQPRMQTAAPAVAALSVVATKTPPTQTPRPSPKNIQSPCVDQGISLRGLQEQVASCTACALSKSRKQTVFGHGNPQPDLLFIGDAPDADDDREGQPFAGKSGVLLNRMIEAMGLHREQVYTMNTLKCRPPWNRDPSSEEIAACRVYFDAQLQALQPNFICLLGRVAAWQVLGTHDGLTVLREGTYDYQGIPVYVTYHPTYLLRNPARKQQAWQDLQRLMQLHIKPQAAHISSE